MCITFFYINPESSSDQYRFVLVFNRDEFYGRKTETAHFWKEYSTVIGGRDKESDACGTWLAASHNGKLGALLNINSESNNDHLVLESRGALVSDYVTGNMSPREYVQNVSDSKKVYNGYNLVLFDLMADDSNVLIHTSTDLNEFRETIELKSGIYGISNSRLNIPYQKVEYGKQMFENIMEKYNYVNKRDSLIAELLKILKSRIKNYPDDVLYKSKRQTMEENYIEELSSIFVAIPDSSYGTRTHTIILIDHDNVVDFNEFNMPDPNDTENSEWDHRNFMVDLQKFK